MIFRDEGQNMQTEFIETDAGIFTASFSENGLARLEFPRGQKDPRTAATRASWQQRRWLSATARALREALAGRPPEALLMCRAPCREFTSSRRLPTASGRCPQATMEIFATAR